MARCVLATVSLVAAFASVPTLARAGEPDYSKGIEVRVLVLNFDPRVPQEGNRRLHEICKWNDPRKLADGYIADVRAASGDFIRYRVVDWRDLDAYTRKADGFVYTHDAYLKCFREQKGWHQPDGADYPGTIAEYGVIALIDRGTVDEVWWFGAPYLGYWESAMAGPRAFYINGGVYEEVGSKRPFAVMGFNYERGVAEMLHDLSHRTESTMTRVYGGWKADELTHNWARFAANHDQSKGVAAVGSCHWPPNGQKDYDYSNRREVVSTADDWLNYPNLRGLSRKLNCEAWGGPDYHRNYMKWWFERIPKARGWNADGRLNNWWVYVFDFDRYDDQGRLRGAPPTTRPAGP